MQKDNSDEPTEKKQRNLSNRFRVLDVEDLLSDCDDNDETEDSSFTYERMTGGGEISNDEKTVSSETSTTTSAEHASESRHHRRYHKCRRRIIL